MSYNTWHIDGYGICVDHIKIDSVDRLEELLSLAPKYRQEIHKWFKDCDIVEPTIDDYLEFDQDYYLGLATLLKNVIEEADGMELTACDDFDGIDFLVYEPCYPWQMTKEDLSMTEEKVVQLFRKYVSILTDQAIAIEYQSVGNGG